MKTKWKALVSAAVLAISSTAFGAITVTQTAVTPSTGTLSNFTIYRLYAAFDANSAEAQAGATGLQSVAATVTTTENLKFKVNSDINFDSFNDVDVFGATIADNVARASTSGTALGTIIRVNPPGGFTAVSVIPTYPVGTDLSGVAGTKSATDVDGNLTYDPVPNFAAVKSFRVEGAALGGSDPTALTPSAGQAGAGALFAVIVVPKTATGTVVGTVAGDKGGTTPFAINLSVPEPATFGILGLAGVGLLGRRRRNA